MSKRSVVAKRQKKGRGGNFFQQAIIDTYDVPFASALRDFVRSGDFNPKLVSRALNNVQIPVNSAKKMANHLGYEHLQLFRYPPSGK